VRDLEPEFGEELEFGVRDFSITGFGTTKGEIINYWWGLLLVS
jgi:hypothetical protein